jgi:hypothetical protein
MMQITLRYEASEHTVFDQNAFGSQIGKAVMVDLAGRHTTGVIANAKVIDGGQSAEVTFDVEPGDTDFADVIAPGYLGAFSQGFNA